jgi:hypothetical protein
VFQDTRTENHLGKVTLSSLLMDRAPHLTAHLHTFQPTAYLFSRQLVKSLNLIDAVFCSEAPLLETVTTWRISHPLVTQRTIVDPLDHKDQRQNRDAYVTCSRHQQSCRTLALH